MTLDDSSTQLDAPERTARIIADACQRSLDAKRLIWVASFDPGAAWGQGRCWYNTDIEPLPTDRIEGIARAGHYMPASKEIATMSYKAEVTTDNTGTWASNALVFATQEEALAYASDLAGRWTLVRETRVVPTDDAVNAEWCNGRLQHFPVSKENTVDDNTTPTGHILLGYSVATLPGDDGSALRPVYRLTRPGNPLAAFDLVRTIGNPHTFYVVTAGSGSTGTVMSLDDHFIFTDKDGTLAPGR